MRIDHQHKLHIVALLAALASGCSAHASFRAEAGSYGENGHGPVASGGEHTRPASTAPVPSPGAVAPPARASEQALQQASAPAAPPAAPATTTPVSTPQPIAHAPQAQPTPRQGDHDRGHGNDADRHDEDNPGHKQSAKRVAQSGDHDRGHGNDTDGVDEQNPGKSKKKK